MRGVRAMRWAAMLVTGALSAPAWAGTVYMAAVHDYRTGGGFTLSGASPVDTGPGTTQAQSAYYDWHAAAEPGELRAKIHAVITDAYPHGFFKVAQAWTRSSFTDDVYFTGRTDTSPLPVSFNMHLSGFLEVVDIPQLLSLGSHSSVTIKVFAGTQEVGTGSVGVGDGGYVGTGMLAGLVPSSTRLDIDGSFTTPSFQVTPNAAVQIGFLLEVFAGVAGSGSGPESASADFFSTASYPLTGPVFNLGSGWTANSASGQIVDNRWIGAPAAVPLPSSAALGLSMMGVLGGLAWSRRRRKGVSGAQ